MDIPRLIGARLKAVSAKPQGSNPQGSSYPYAYSYSYPYVGIIISIPTTTPRHARANELRYQALICESILLVIEAFKQGVELHDVGAYDTTLFRGTLVADLNNERE